MVGTSIHRSASGGGRATPAGCPGLGRRPGATPRARRARHRLRRRGPHHLHHGASPRHGRALMDLTPHKITVRHLVQVFAPLAQAGGDLVPPVPFESVTHHNCLGLFHFTFTRVIPDRKQGPWDH